MPSFVPAEKNVSYTFYTGLISQADTKRLQISPTLAAGDVKVAVDDAAPANLATLPVVDADFTKRVKVVLSASEMNGDNITVIFSDAAGAEWTDLIVNFQTVARQLDDLAFPATAGRSITVETDGQVHADLKEWLGVAPNALNSGSVQADVQRWRNAAPNILNSGTVQADVQRWLNAVPSALISGRVDASIGAMAANVLTAAAINAAAITAAKFAVGALDANALNDDAAVEIANKVLTGTTLAELTAAIPDATPTLAKALMLFYMMTRNKFTSTATLLQVHNDAGAVIAKKVLADDGTTYTETKAVAGP